MVPSETDQRTEPERGYPQAKYLFLILPLALAGLVGIVLLGAPTLAAAQVVAPSAAPAACQPVTDVALAYMPPDIYTGTPALFLSQILTGSLPVTYTFEFGDGSDPVTGTVRPPTATFTATHAYTLTGSFPITLTTWNTCTLPPLTTTVQITVAERPCLTPTGIALIYTPTKVYSYQDILFAAEVATATFPLTYTWDFGDGLAEVSGTTPGPVFTATHAFTTAQDYTVTLAAWNICAITPTQEAITLTVAPCGVISDVSVTYWPTDARAGVPITFASGVTNVEPLPDQFEWTFGDGYTGTGQVVTHTYATAHELLSYTVSMTAANFCSQKATTTTLQVGPAPWLIFLPMIEGKGEPPPPKEHLGYGSNVASADHASYLAEMGFDWAKGWATWPSGGWGDVDNQMREFLKHVPNVLIRIHGSNPPISEGDRTAFRNYAQALAKHVSDTWRPQGLKVVAYEIWNEPNLDHEWGGTPNAALYTALLKAGYQGVKAGDPGAIVVSAGLAPTGGLLNDGPTEQSRVIAEAREIYDANQVVPDLTFTRQMYDHGAKGFFDAMGTHPYGGSYPPDTSPDDARARICFRRAEEQRQVMLDYGDTSPMWNTESGWIVESGCHVGEHEWMEVSEAQQAQYLADAYAYADEHWPWMGPMFFFNLDFGTVSWYADCDPMRWYSITYRSGGGPIQFRQAFYSLRDMPKNSAW